MAHGITKYDKGLVGLCEVFGGTWHRLPQYQQLNGALPLDDVRKALEYEVVKVPLAFNTEAFPKLASIHHQPVVMPDIADGGDNLVSGQKMYALVRTDHGVPVHSQSVTDEYVIFPNKSFLDLIRDQLLANYPMIAIESCGSLWAGRVSFVNLLLNRFRVKKDESETVSRLMLYNAFGGRSISGCGHNTRVVCNNTAMIAEAQGEINKTLKKFKHTSGASTRLVDHLVDLAKLQALMAARQEIMNRLVEQQMTAKDVKNFLGHMFPLAKDAGPTAVTRRTNNRNEVNRLFETLPDLQGGIARTRYAMYQATTYYNQHSTTSNAADPTYTWWHVATGSGDRHARNQTAFDLLTMPTIPDVPSVSADEMDKMLVVGKN